MSADRLRPGIVSYGDRRVRWLTLAGPEYGIWDTRPTRKHTTLVVKDSDGTPVLYPPGLIDTP